MKSITFASDAPEVWDLYGRLSGDLAFDVGANGGMVSRLLAPRFGEVVAFEPCMESMDRLVADDTPKNVTPIRLAVSDHDGPISLRVAKDAIALGELVTGDTLSDLWGEDMGSVDVEAITLDQCVALFGVPDLVKIDTEGHEDLVVLGGRRRLFAEHHPRLIIEVHSAPNASAITAILDRYELRTVRHPYYQRGTWEWQNHFWLLSEGIE